MTDKEYYSDKSMMTNTMLGWIMVGPKYFKKQLSLVGLEKIDEETYLIFGNAVHCKLLESDKFSKQYYVRRYDAPSNAVQKKFCSILISHNKSDKKSLEMAFKMSYSTAKLSDKIVLNNATTLFKSYKDYIIQEQTNSNKIGLSKTDYAKIKAIENNVKLHKRANELLFKRNSKLVIVQNEEVIKWEYEGTKFKSKLDRFIIDLKNKKIILIDVKTHSSKKEDVPFTDSFSKSFSYFNYDRQLYMYSVALRAYFKEKYSDYNIVNFTIEHKIIALQKNFDNQVKVFDISDDIIYKGGHKFTRAFEAYLFYEENGYDYDFTCNKDYEEQINI